MEQMITWFREQWACKKFRMLTVAIAVITIILGLEFYLFQYGFFKILRYFILFWASS